MPIIKRTKDYLIKALNGGGFVPRELLDLHDYFRVYGPINFRHEKGDGVTIAISTNFQHGSIVTSGKNSKELDRNIKDAILTSFEVPSSYSKEAKIHKEGKQENVYALA